MSYHLNKMHDFFYNLGFTEAAGNFQVSNFNKGGSPLDPVLGEAQFGLGSEDDFFVIPGPDGFEGFAAFGLSDDGLCRRDASFDASIIYHEYAHLVNARMLGVPEADILSLNSFQGHALDEGWSDAFANSVLNSPVIGAYFVCDPVGIRSARYNAHPGKYSDFGNKHGPFPVGIGEVFTPDEHDDGEIWGATMWDLRTAVGKEVFESLLFDGLKYTPLEPSMLDARDGILIADLIRFNGSNKAKLWTVFAARGLGASASTSPGTFEGLPALNGWESTVFAAFDKSDLPYGNGQLTLFDDDFEGPDRGWTVAGDDGVGGGPLWHLSNRRFSSETKAYYYGDEGSGTYNTGAANFGSLISPPIKLPSALGNTSIMLEWDQFRLTADSFFEDGGWVRIIDVNGGTTTQVSFVQNSPISLFGDSSFARQRVNLNAFAGKLIQVEFYMDTLDSIFNDEEGWYIDNVKVAVLGVPNNAGFETGKPAAWAVYGGVVGGVKTGQAHTGSFSLYETSGVGGFSQNATGLIPGQQYVVRAWVKGTAGTSAKARLLVDDTTGGGANTFTPVTVTTTWQRLQANFKATATGKVRIKLDRTAGTGTLYWDDVEVAAGSPGGPNLGFETGSLSPWTATGGVTATVVGAPVHAGSRSLSQSGSPGGVYQDIAGLVPGRVYTVSAYARSAPGTTAQAELHASDTTGANIVTDGFRTPSSTAWNPFTVRFVATTTNAVRIQLLFDGGAGTIFWDDIKVAEGSPAPLIQNGRFETNLAGWTKYGTVTTSVRDVAQHHTGKASLRQSGPGNGGRFHDVTGLIPGQQYRVGVFVKGSGGTASCSLIIADPSGGGQLFVSRTPGAGSWAYLEVPFIATDEGVARVKLQFNSGTGSVYFDDVSIR